MRVVHFQRKPRIGNFSIETVFDRIRKELPQDISCQVKVMKYYSNGFWKRLYACLEAAGSQGQINHVTGDIHFITLFLAKKRTVLTIHDILAVESPNPFKRFIFKWFWIVFPIKKSAIVTTVSEATKSELLRYVRIDSNRIFTVPDPISDLFTPSPKTFNKTHPTILQIGTKRNKNVVRLIESLKGIDCRLEIVGELTEEIRLALSENSTVYTKSCNISTHEILEKYRNSDIIAFVSTYEGFGMPIIEANAIGRVVVTSNVASMPEVAGDAAHLVDPFDVSSIRTGILKVIEDDAYREHLIANGFINKERFGAIKVAEMFAEIYRYLMNRDLADKTQRKLIFKSKIT